MAKRKTHLKLSSNYHDVKAYSQRLPRPKSCIFECLEALSAACTYVHRMFCLAGLYFQYVQVTLHRERDVWEFGV